MSKEIPLSRGLVVIVDDDVYEWASEYKWFAHRGGGYGQNFYAARSIHGPPRKHVYLHREILKAPAGMVVDHINRDCLDCRRSNLRLATHAENQGNSRRSSNNTSGYKGVSRDSRSGKWAARIMINRKTVHLGTFSEPEAAARAYDEAARQYFGDYARTNEGVTP